MPFDIPERDPCPFCENLAGRVDPDSEGIQKWAVVAQSDIATAFVSPYQSREGYLLVVPNRHAPTVLDLTDQEMQAIAGLVRRVAQALHASYGPVGMNIFQNNGIAARQRIPHYHVHVMPRYPDDGPTFGKEAVFIDFDERIRIATKIKASLK